MMSCHGQTGQRAGGSPGEGASSAEAAAAVVRHARDVGRLGKAGGQDAHALQQLAGHLPPLVGLRPAHASSASAPCAWCQLAPATPDTHPLFQTCQSLPSVLSLPHPARIAYNWDAQTCMWAACVETSPSSAMMGEEA